MWGTRDASLPSEEDRHRLDRLGERASMLDRPQSQEKVVAGTSGLSSLLLYVRPHTRVR